MNENEYDEGDHADFGMFSDEGNARVGEVVDEVVAAGRADDSDYVYERLDALALDPAFAEATDTVVRDAVHEELRLRVPNES